MLRKLFLVGLIVFMLPGTVIQQSIFLFLCGICLFTHLKHQPFEEEFDNKVATYTHIGLTTAIFCGIMVYMTMCEMEKDQAGIAETTKLLFSFLVLFINFFVLFMIFYLTVTNALYTQLRLVFVAAIVIWSYSQSLVKKLNGEGDDGVTGKRKANKNAKTAKAIAHEKWLEELADELQAYYQNQEQMCVTSEGFSGMTLVCFARLVAAWDPRMNRTDFQHLLGCMKNDEQPWMVSSRAFKLWTSHTFGAFTEDVCVQALESVTPIDMPSRLQMRVKAATCVRNWLMKEDEPCWTQKEKSDVSLKKRIWANQLLEVACEKESSGAIKTMNSSMFFNIATEAMGDTEARKACTDTEKLWDAQGIGIWLESTGLSRRDFNAVMLRLMASKQIVRDEHQLQLSRMRTHTSVQMGMELARCHDSTWMSDELMPMNEIMKTVAMPEALTMGGGDAVEDVVATKTDEPALTAFDPATFDAVMNRYDLDQSGRIDSESLMPCTLNLVLKLQIGVNPMDMEAAVEALVAGIENKADEPEECMMTQEEYKAWFIESFAK